MPLDNRPHWDDVEIEQYSLGKLPGPKVEALEEHLLVCPLCRNNLRQNDAFTGAIRRVSARLQAEDEARRPARLPPWLAGSRIAWAVAGIALVVAASLVAYLRPIPGILGPPAIVYLEALRGASDIGHVPAGRIFVARLDVRSLPPAAEWLVELVDRDGRRIWQGPLKAAGAVAEGRIDAPLRSGQYFVRLQSVSGELLREFSLTAR